MNFQQIFGEQWDGMSVVILFLKKAKVKFNSYIVLWK